MKSAWKYRPLGEICDVVGGGTPSKRIERYYSGSIPWATVRDMQAEVIQRTEFKITEEALKASATNVIHSGNLVIASRVGLGKVCLLGQDTAINQDLRGIVPRDRKTIEPRFLYMWFKSISEIIIAEGTGATVQGVKLPFIKSLQVPLPPLSEQRRIVGMLDKAFESIAVAKADTEKNLQNTHEIFEHFLKAIFSHGSENTTWSAEAIPEQDLIDQIKNQFEPKCVSSSEVSHLRSIVGRVTKTGGRAATTRKIYGGYSLAVGRPNIGAKKGWSWSLLGSLARLESGHTPSRRHSEYWGGKIPWIGIQDARESHGLRINDTKQKISELGISNSSARLLPVNTVCLSRTASVGYVVIMGRQMATSQDFVNWICSKDLLPEFLKYIFLAEGRTGLLKFTSGSVHPTLYYPEAKALYVCHPSIDVQRKIVLRCDAVLDQAKRLSSIYQRKIAALDELKKSLLHQAFSGNL